MKTENIPIVVSSCCVVHNIYDLNILNHSTVVGLKADVLHQPVQHMLFERQVCGIIIVPVLV